VFESSVRELREGGWCTGSARGWGGGGGGGVGGAADTCRKSSQHAATNKHHNWALREAVEVCTVSIFCRRCRCKQLADQQQQQQQQQQQPPGAPCPTQPSAQPSNSHQTSNGSSSSSRPPLPPLPAEAASLAESISPASDGPGDRLVLPDSSIQDKALERVMLASSAPMYTAMVGGWRL
jgi:hypothetical protein